MAGRLCWWAGPVEVGRCPEGVWWGSTLGQVRGVLNPASRIFTGGPEFGWTLTVWCRGIEPWAACAWPGAFEGPADRGQSLKACPELPRHAKELQGSRVFNGDCAGESAGPAGPRYPTRRALVHDMRQVLGATLSQTGQRTEPVVRTKMGAQTGRVLGPGVPKPQPRCWNPRRQARRPAARGCRRVQQPPQRPSGTHAPSEAHPW